MELGHAATPIWLPLDDADQLRTGVETMAANRFLPSAAVLCGGPAPDVSPLLKLTPQQFRRQLECAVVGHAVLLAELWRLCLRRQGGGHVLAVLSAAQWPTVAPHMASYVAAKGGLEALLRAALAELGPAGLRVSVARPGYVETPMLDAFDERFLERARKQSANRRFLQPCEVAGALVAALPRPPEAASVGEIALAQPEGVFA
jgi:3-oxoacyl-[acyl-carrier protein] reductase